MNLPTSKTSSTSPANAPALDERWIEKLFQKFEDFYGAKWAAQYGAFPRERVKRTWAEELAGFADKGDAIAQAFNAQKSSPFPPTLPEFLALCREAARRIGDKAPLALPHKLTPEEIERNRKRAAEMIAGLAKAKSMGPFHD